MTILHLSTNVAARSSFIPYHLGTKLLGFTLNVDEVHVDPLKKYLPIALIYSRNPFSALLTAW